MELSLSISYSVDTTLCISPQKIREIYLHGISLEDRDGNKIPDSSIVHFIKVAQAEVERFFSIKLKRQVYVESKSYSISDFVKWGYIIATYPVNCAESIEGFYANRKLISYPKDWISVRRTNSNQFNRSISLIPNSPSSSGESLIYSTSLHSSQFYGTLGRDTLPNYWQLTYVTGFDEIPLDLLDLLGKYVSISLLPILSDSMNSLSGISSNSISLDGLSKSSSFFANSQGGIFGARVKQYTEEIKDKLNYLKDYYCGIPFDVF